MSGIEAHVLHADDFLSLVLGDCVRNSHVVGGQVQLVGAGQRVIARERVREGRDRLVQQVKIVRCTVHRSGCGKDSISCQEEPGKRTRRSLTYSPRLGELLAGERGRIIARAGVGLNARHGDASPDLPAQPLQLGPQRIQFGTGNAARSDASALTRLPQFGASGPSVDR
jgi:hypothetical protein